jgi:hypothetical protein
MDTQTETLTIATAGPDVSIVKTERFDPDFARFILENKDVSSDERAAVRRLYKNRKDGNKHETRYKLGKDIKHEDAGRFHAVHAEGLQCLSRDCRSALAQKFYWDVDIQNAQPTLLEQLAQKHGWVCGHLAHYNANRDDYIAELMEQCGCERWEAKEKVCRLMFGGSAMGMSSFFVSELQPEVGTLMRNVYKEYAKTYPFAAKRGERSLMAMVLQTIERKCLLALDVSLTKQGRSLDVYIHDGGLVLKKEGEARMPDTVLRQAEADISASEGYKVRLAVKELKTTLVRTEDDDDALLPQSVLVDDRFAAMRFVELMGDLFVMDAGHLWVFNPETGMWSNDKAVLERVITGLNGKLVFRQMGAMGVKTYDYSGCVEKRNSLIKMLPAVARVQDGYFRSRLSSDKGKLLFKDGIYDFASKTFTAGFDPQVIFHAACPRKFPGEADAEKVAFVHSVLFEMPFKDAKEADRLRHNLMRAMIGDWRRKTFVVALGPKNSSKSTLIFTAKTMFGSYVGEFDANSMLIRHGGEAARDLLWVSDLYHCRFAFSSEIKQDEKTQLAIDGNMLKKLVSGGTDTISFRKMCVNDADKVFFRPTIFILANDLPKITPCSEEINDRLQVVDYHYSFQSKPTELHHKPLDREIGTKMAQDDYADAFFWVLTQEYQAWEQAGFPELPPCETELQEDLMEQANVKNILLGRYELTGADTDQVDAKEVQAYLRQGGFIGSETRVTREMKQLGLGTERVRKGRQRVKVYTGLKIEELA